MAGVAVARFGISVSQFYSMTPIEFHEATRDYQEMKRADYDVMTRTVFESMRTQTLYIHGMNPYAKKKYKDPVKFMKFSWDTKPAQSMEQMKGILQTIARTFNKKEKKGKK